jgi:hypothetical protein
MVERQVVRSLMGIVFGLLASGGPACSAVRDCGVFIAGSGEGRTQAEATAKALDVWTQKVMTLGRVKAQWRVSVDRSLSCEAAGDAYRCHALARPCVIRQVAPEGWSPDKRRDVLKGGQL